MKRIFTAESSHCELSSHRVQMKVVAKEYPPPLPTNTNRLYQEEQEIVGDYVVQAHVRRTVAGFLTRCYNSVATFMENQN